MTETEKIEYTKAFIDKLANGINPLDDTAIPEGDLLNNVRISRCMFYVSGILERIVDYLKRGTTTSKKLKKVPFSITPEQLARYEFDEEPLYLSKIAAKINDLIDLNEIKRLKIRSITKWLLSAELLAPYVAQNGKTYNAPTEKGKEFGITTEPRMGKNGQPYNAVLYGAKAQKEIVAHLSEIVEINNAEVDQPPEDNLENQGKSWLPSQNKQLIDMFNDGIALSDIAAEMKRTERSILARLVKFGLLEKEPT